MARSKTPSFITELEILPTPQQTKRLRSRFEAARQVYNACLGECLKRLELLRQSRIFNRARKLPKGKERTDAFKEANTKVGFREFDIHKWATRFTTSWINEHVDARTVEQIVTTAFQAAQTCAIGRRGRPRFKRKGELNTIEGKTGSACRWNPELLSIVWKGLTIPARSDEDDPVVAHGLAAKVKYVRLTRRTIRGKERFYAQLVNEGLPYKKPEHTAQSGTVGLDLGPSTIAVVGEDQALLQPFCAELEDHQRAIRREQRALDRRRRANNPQNYNEDGTIRRGPKTWTASKRQRRLERHLADLQRRQASQRKNLHGRLVNRVFGMGDDIRTEALSYKAFQSRFGKSVGFRAPGTFVLRLRNAAAKYRATVTEFSTKTTKLSQTCHNCGRIFKKPLRQRWHDCDCGVKAQRDLYSAFLARFVQGDRLDADQAKSAWSGACALLDAALSFTRQQVMGGFAPASLGLRGVPSQNLSRRKHETKPAKAADDVPAREGGESRVEVGGNRGHTAIRWRPPPNDV
jgi:putative transposase